MDIMNGSHYIVFILRVSLLSLHFSELRSVQKLKSLHVVVLGYD